MDIAKYKRDTGDDSAYAYLLDAALKLLPYERKKLAAVLITSTLGDYVRDEVISDTLFLNFDG